MKSNLFKFSLLLIFICLFLIPLFGCEHQETLENTRFTIDGKEYEIKITETEGRYYASDPVNSERGTVSPPRTKYAVVTPDEVYLTNTVLYLYPNVITIVNYSIKEYDGVWVWHEERLNLSKEKDGPIKVEQLKM